MEQQYTLDILYKNPIETVTELFSSKGAALRKARKVKPMYRTTSINYELDLTIALTLGITIDQLDNMPLEIVEQLREQQFNREEK